jgi:hypothetical protein
MKKLSIFIAAIVCSLVFSVSANAQASGNKFVGKWSTLMEGAPGGDSKGIIVLTRDGEKLAGIFTGEKEENKITFSKIDEKEKSITLYFTAAGYDCYLFLEPKDENHLEGSMMDMFDFHATRVVETENK